MSQTKQALESFCERVSLDTIIDAIERQTFGLDNPGFCLVCGEESDICEPDARNYRCESCGKRAVFGAEQILFMGLSYWEALENQDGTIKQDEG